MKASILALALIAATSQASVLTNHTEFVSEFERDVTFYKLTTTSMEGNLVWSMNCFDLEGHTPIDDMLIYTGDLGHGLIATMVANGVSNGVINYPFSNMVTRTGGALFDFANLEGYHTVTLVSDNEITGTFDFTQFKTNYQKFMATCSGAL